MSFNFLLRHRWAKIALIYWIILIIWWFKLFLSGSEEGTENYIFNLSYFFFNAVGGIGGIIVAKKWSGFSSAVGRGLMFLSFGLLGQGIGLLIWSYYNLILLVEVPYPSLADIGYFSLIPFYTIALLNFAKVTGAKIALRSVSGWVQVVLLPTAILSLSYLLFIRDVGFDTPLLETVLNIAYPAGEALSLSLGFLVYTLSKNYLGGKFKSHILFIIFALTFQYAAEFAFLYTLGIDTFYNASFIDPLYMTAYFFMALALLSFDIKE